MNSSLLKYYNQELQYLREMGGEFAAAYPKVAGRLGLESFECADPYVERLLEGFSFLAARVQMKLDAEFPRFTQHLTEIVYPQYLAPTPSMAVVQFEPEWAHPALVGGTVVPRHTALNSQLDRYGTTRCEYRTAHELTLWPLRLVEANYFAYSGAVGGVTVNVPSKPQAALRLRFDTSDGVTLRALDLDRMPLYLRGTEGFAERLYEQLMGHVVQAIVLFSDRSAVSAIPATRYVALPGECIVPLGFDDEQALLPLSSRTFRGYRLLHEYFAFPQRFLFVEVTGLRDALRECDASASSFELVLLLDEHDQGLERSVDASNFALYCTPAINLFPRRADRIALNDEQFEYHVVVDRTRPIDFEVYAVELAEGYSDGDFELQYFEPFYRAHDANPDGEAGGAYFQLRRETRARSERERRYGARSRYLGSEVSIALVDAAQAPFNGKLRQLGLDLLCTNRDLPLSMPVGVGSTDFTSGVELPVASVRCLSGPSEPRPIFAEGASAWRFVNHLSLNYLSLVDSDPGGAVRALRELLELYCAGNDDAGHRQIAALSGLVSRAVTRRLPGAGPISFGRGLELTVTFDEAGFEGAGAFLIGSVLQAFFASYVSINHFTETVVRSSMRGEIMRWPARMGLCQIL
ncbi:type VI secretion system protein ImpG [Burkholderia cepacia]|uniref:type VI secretion system baseplate subunit TssF n=1 Tax=Burkholderia cepacia TaxID=292 RepID=UPI000758BFB4|nr:type VI secretion system baseplate subunit TssF [Burkholderia cepacia]KVA46779.1 type VI secretion system protein ImpG [Burkholderia cepacia]KVA51578.1 type VI secretion system protein ImpG [Burkholderia cepacia]KVA70842.1 type VI secretion system protein ImpG [Burkholderia cepacia]KVA78902.1 type VI secretion system protein ImpG [Burkholderia cepacia]KVA78924.1 type VI secretion system protein ImpG [Burkholderia cepacia]